MSILPLVAIFPMVTSAAGLPVTFQTGNAAKASEVNQNFKYLDSAVNDHQKQLDTKAEQSAVLGVVSTVGAKVDTAALTSRLGKYALSSSISGFVTSAALTQGLAAKVDTGKFQEGLGRKLDTSALAGRLGDYAKTSALSGFATTTALTTGLAAKPDRSEVMVVGKTGANIPEGVTVTGASPELQVGYTQLYSGQLALRTDTSATTYGFPSWYVSANSTDGFQVGRYGGGPTSTTYYLTILPGTGTTLRGAVKTTDSLVVGKNLHVGGKIFASTGTITVPDYVFEPEYKLASLDEVEAFTQRNRHLPDVPSAAQIKDGGLDLTAMNLALLRKVEELTLHAIAQEKRIRSLEARLGE